MDGEGWDVVVTGVAIHQATGGLVPVEIGWRGGADPAVEVACGNRRLEVMGRPAAAITFVFADGGSGGGEEVTVRDPLGAPTSIDGSPRSQLRDRLARRHACEAVEGLVAD